MNHSTDLRFPAAPGRVGPPARVLSVRTRPDGVAVLTYDVPGAPLNVLGPAALGELERALDEIGRDPSIRAAILVSGKPESWIAGADLEMLESITTAAEGEAICRSAHRVARRLSESRKPV